MGFSVPDSPTGSTLTDETCGPIPIPSILEVPETFETVIQCIAHTRTRRGGQVQAQLDEREYDKGRQADDETIYAAIGALESRNLLTDLPTP